jgi:cytoskeletal protein CcmA (bactofilin family)
MALFDKKEEPEQVTTTARGDKLNTVIGKDSVFDGKLNVTGTLRIDGKVTGEILVSDTINIGSTGEVEASIKTKNAVIAGTIRGNIHATEKTELQAKSVIYGDIVTKSLAIEQGSVFQGHCNMGDIKERDLQPAKTPVASTPKETVSSAEKKR